MRQPKRVVFAGTPAFAVPALNAVLNSASTVVGVYTQPDRRAGRGRQLAASPVKKRALEANVPIYQPASLRDGAEHARLAGLEPDVIIVVAYGLLLPPAILEIPRYGCVNIHASLLPRWRGAAPIQRALLAGDTETGVSIMQMDSGLDTGSILAQQRISIGAEETAASLHDRLATLGASAVIPVLHDLASGTAKSRPQAEDRATYADKLHKRDAQINWHEPATTIARRIRALQPWPVAETKLDGIQLRLWQAQALPWRTQTRPGTVVAVEEGFDVATGDGKLRVRTVQRAGRNRMNASDFARGNALIGKVLT